MESDKLNQIGLYYIGLIIWLCSHWCEHNVIHKCAEEPYTIIGNFLGLDLIKSGPGSFVKSPLQLGCTGVTFLGWQDPTRPITLNRPTRRQYASLKSSLGLPINISLCPICTLHDMYSIVLFVAVGPFSNDQVRLIN